MRSFTLEMCCLFLHLYTLVISANFDRYTEMRCRGRPVSRGGRRRPPIAALAAGDRGVLGRGKVSGCDGCAVNLPLTGALDTCEHAFAQTAPGCTVAPRREQGGRGCPKDYSGTPLGWVGDGVSRRNLTSILSVASRAGETSRALSLEFRRPLGLRSTNRQKGTP